jgi:hypothetical protein
MKKSRSIASKFNATSLFRGKSLHTRALSSTPLKMAHTTRALRVRYVPMQIKSRRVSVPTTYLPNTVASNSTPQPPKFQALSWDKLVPDSVMNVANVPTIMAPSFCRQDWETKKQTEGEAEPRSRGGNPPRQTNGHRQY